MEEIRVGVAAGVSLGVCPGVGVGVGMGVGVHEGMRLAHRRSIAGEPGRVRGLWRDFLRRDKCSAGVAEAVCVGEVGGDLLKVDMGEETPETEMLALDRMSSDTDQAHWRCSQFSTACNVVILSRVPRGISQRSISHGEESESRNLHPACCIIADKDSTWCIPHST